MELEPILDTFFDLLGNPLIQVAGTILTVLLLQLIIHAVIGRVVKRAVRSDKYAKKIDEQKRENTLINIFKTASAVVIWIIAIVVILWQLDVNIAALATGAGLIGIIVGFGAQNTIKDFLGGMFIILENQYRVGDIIGVKAEGGEVAGFVEDITIRITRLRDLDGNLHIIQNGSIHIVTNLSFDFANVNVDVGVAYDTDIDKVEKVMNEVGDAMLNDEKWGEYIIEPIHFFRVDGFEDSAIRIKALGKVEPAQQWDIASVFRRRLIEAFRKNKITIPFPQLDIHPDHKQ